MEMDVVPALPQVVAARSLVRIDQPMMRWILAIVAWLVTVAVLAPAIFFAVILLAGPHSSMLPSVLQSVVVITGWIVFLAGPVWVARIVWSRFAR
jgi:hypothetical protein